MVRVSGGLRRGFLPVSGSTSSGGAQVHGVLGPWHISAKFPSSIETQHHLFTQRTPSGLHIARPMVQALRVL